MKVDQILTEAARFDRAALQMTLANLDGFLFGIEYEFLVKEGIPYMDTFIDETEPHENDKIRAMMPFIVSLTTAVDTIKKYDLQYYVSVLDDFIRMNGPNSVAQYIGNTIFPDAFELAEALLKVIDSTNQINRIYAPKEADGIGLYSGGLSNQEIEVLKAMTRLDQSRITPTPQNVKAVRSVLNTIKKYDQKDTDMLPKTITPRQLANSIMAVIHAELVEEKKSSPTKIDVVKNTLPIDRSKIENITHDMTVPNGAEVVTVPMSFRATAKTMRDMFAYIKKVGGTDNSCGIHVNISMPRLSDVDIGKMIVLLDTDFMQGLSPGAKNRIKYPVRSAFTKPSTQVLRNHVTDLARIQAKRGPEEMLSNFKYMLAEYSNAKKRAINVKALFGQNESARRIEFRYLGGAGYENRLEEILNDILQICYVMLAATDPTFLRRDFILGSYRMLDRAVRDAEIAVHGKKITSFLDLVEYYKRTG